MATRKNSRREAITDKQAEELATALHALGDYAHVSVRAERGHLNIYPGDDDPVARLTPVGGGQYGLTFHRHTGQWERMPFAGDLAHMAETIVTTLGMYLDRWEFSRGMSGSDH
jgi:hypothetical protein